MAGGTLSFSDLPSSLAVFPLTGALLLPAGQLPLNIFEPRYLAMFRDAMATPHRLIGMVQAQPDGDINAQPQPNGGVRGQADLYHVGCAGRLTAFSETSDGRFLVTLSGLIRFDILEELPLDVAGYRRVRPDFLGYDDDLALEQDAGMALDDGRRARFLGTMRAYFKQHGFDTDWRAVERASARELVTSLAMACPFAPAEKQALLEASNQEDQFKTLEGLLTMGAMDMGQGQH